MVSPVLTEQRHSGGFLVSEARGTRSRAQGTLLQQTYTPPVDVTPAGTVLGQFTNAAAGTYAANAGNTGNFTCGTVTPAAAVVQGVYNIEFIAATVFNVYFPNGELVAEGHTGVAFSAGGLGFTITAGGTAAVAGDGATITVAVNSNQGIYAPLNLSADDGSQNAAAILFNVTDASGGNTKVAVIVRECEVNASELIWPSGITANQITAALAQLAVNQIISR